MNRLEILYGEDVRKIAFTVRKVNLEGTKIILKGPRHSGKTYVILDLLSTRKKESYLYIDFADIRIDASIAAYLEAFLKRHPRIELLVLENLDFAFPLPDVREMIITTSQKDFHLSGFSEISLYPPDFEEFIAFQKRSSDIEALFGQFANTGTFPQIFDISRFSYVHHFQQMLSVYYTTPVELEILKTFALRQSTLVSTFAMFNLVKKKHKISKDKFYLYTHRLQNEEVIFMVEKYGQKSAPKKLYMIDFAIRGVLSFEKDFIRRFENMVFLELYKRGYDIYYHERFDFYIPQLRTVLFSFPFSAEKVIEKRVQKAEEELLKLGVKQVQMITMNSRKSFSQNGIHYEMMPFWNWAVQLA
ncbi:MAG: ATP-binding protein [Sulfurospirillum sp.]|nr:MAG: ATP-binding protein [Sulfurospirillum sp.]